MDLKYRIMYFCFFVVALVIYILARYIMLGKKPSKKMAEKANEYFEKSMELESKNDFKGAIQNLNKAICICDDKYEYYMFRSNAYMHLSTPNFNKALNDVNYAMTLKPDDVELYIARISIHKEMGNLNLAYDDAKHVCHIAPNVKNYVDCANIAVLMKDKDKILLELNNALNIAKKIDDKKLIGLISEKINKLNES